MDGMMLIRKCEIFGDREKKKEGHMKGRLEDS
jgi:hypothetical protein